MSYADEVGELARGLAGLATMRPNHLDDAGFQAALAGRTALLGLLATIHAEASGVTPNPGRMTLADLGRHPVAVFGTALGEHPRPRAGVAPTDLHQRNQPTEAGRLWMDVGLRATLAQREWQGDGERLSGETAWGAVADVAALAKTLVLLDDDLAQAAFALGWPDVVEALSRTNTHPLRIAADETLALAQAGPLSDGTVRRFAVPPLRVLPISGASQLHAGQAQLARLLRHAGPMKPQHVEQIAIAQVRICLHTAQVAKDFGKAPLAAELQQHAQLLSDAVGTARSLASLTAGDPRPRLQASELLRAHRDRDARPAQLEVYAARLLIVTKAIATAAEREVAAGRWLGPLRDHSVSMTWAPLTRIGKAPQLTEALGEAARDGAMRISGWQANAHSAARVGESAPRRALAHMPRQHREPRPASPASASSPLSHHARR